MNVPLENLVINRDWHEIASRLVSRFGVNIEAIHVESMFDEPLKPKWSDGTWLVWLKTRLNNKGMLPVALASSKEIRFACELHVGFTQIEETQEMISRLKNEKVNTECQAARSRLNPEQTGFVCPIDKVAAVVAPKK